MPRFFLSASNISDGIVTIRGDDAQHISRSLRMKPGEHIRVCDMRKIEYDCVLEAFTPDSVTARIISSQPSDTEPPFHIRLYQALPKSDKLDLIIQKAVESGASEIIPFESERCIVKAEPTGSDKEAKKLERRQRIALEAAKQCGRGIVPTVRAPINYDAVIREIAGNASSGGLGILFYEGDGTKSLRELLCEHYPERRCGEIPLRDISIVIGAEGGFSLAEVERAKAAGLSICGLGKRILRCETASGFALACLAFWFEL
ncbi:MAG: 16S rRNA (uracil(1498)-N(3))-methyltransferase [Clostridiales bacterium]|nr:16S rRNA (uracil(1498)-N(3))-methyltransferase [Clostridiales bacterium]